MAVRDSRYRYVGDTVRTDAAGRELVATGLRRRTQRAGRYRHTLGQGERLDLLAQQYYRKPHRWWEICDANPGVLSPWQLVGADPLREARTSVPVAGAPVPWHTVLADLHATTGVERVSLVDSPARPPGPGPDQVLTVLTVWFNDLSVSVTELSTLIATHAPVAPLVLVPGPEGAALVIPPPTGRG